MRIAIDLDNVMVEWQYHWANLYCKWFGRAIDWNDLDSWDACLTLTHFNTMGQFYDWFEAADGWKTQPFVDGAQGFLYQLREIQRKRELPGDPYVSWVFVTSRPTQAGKLAASELASSLYGSMVAFANDDSKGQQNADIWIDDSPAVLRALEQAGKKAIRFNRPWNDGAEATYVADNWNQVMDILVREEGMLQ